MSHYTEILFNKNSNTQNGRAGKKRFLPCLVVLTLVALLVSSPIMLFSASAVPIEPSLNEVLNNLGFTNTEQVDVQTFPAGMYNVTLYAELAAFHDENVLSYYAVGTTDYQTIFSGHEGTTEASGGYVVPPVSKIFSASNEFGISLEAPEYRYFTQHNLNTDFPQQRALVYRNLDNPDMLLIGFEDNHGSTVTDYNDMVFSIVPIKSPEIVSVNRSPMEPGIDAPVTVSANVTRGDFEIDSVILSYQAASASWVNVTMILDSGLYVASIPGQPYDTTVYYKVYALDTVGNFEVTGLFSYLVKPNLLPVANFTIATTPAHTNQIISFDASNSYDLDGSITKYSWDFGDGITGSGKTVTHSYSVYKGYSVTLTVTDNTGSTGSTTKGILIQNQAPVAAINTSLTETETQEIVSFSGVNSYDPDGTIVSYAWDFGDFSSATGVTVTHTYSIGGTYTVTLKVTDNDGATGITTYSKTVNNQPPVAVIEKSAGTLSSGDSVTFNAVNSYDPDGVILSYKWDFGDGTTATDTVTSHTYANNGAYTVTLTVTDNQGATGTAQTTVTSVNLPPVAEFTTSAITVDTDEVISFDASRSNDPDGTIVSYRWNFGDGTTATGVTVEHAYATKGQYTVTLTVTDNDGATDTATATKTALNQPPVAVISEIAQSATKTEAVTFDGSESYDTDGTIVNYAWTFGDGTTATTVEAAHTYAESGVYTVRLTVTDNDGAIDEDTITITVLNSKPVAIFTQSVTTTLQGETVSFDGSESYDTDGTIVNYAWTFGDGTTATGVTVDHVFDQAGEYMVTLTVTDNDASSDSTAAQTTVDEAAVSLALIAVLVLGITPLTLTLIYGLFIRRRKKKQNKEQ
ncbi:MAG: PKD domain-containing protein [Candidatus Bathyarchaeia archaeon]|jgi:PKD repeat protein